MANLVTSLRLVLLFLFVIWIYQAPIEWQLTNPLLLGLIFLLDAVDGFIARSHGETSVFGAAFDVAADRVIENVLWVVLVDLNWVPVWVAIIFLVRGFLVDALRNYQSGAPFDMTRSRLGRFLVKGRFLRFSYALVKFLAFAWWFMLIPLANTDSILWSSHQVGLLAMANGLIYTAVALCLVRGLPVLLESLAAQLKTQ
jgi:CDP-diacylglycerol--glycerol-3-phosphate 3-phosphatidyltransferase